jgi:hypothetical protein
MKKYAQMNAIESGMAAAAASQVAVIKRHRNARRASFTDPDEFSHMTKILSNLDTLKV